MSKYKHTPGPWEASFTDCLGGPASYCRIRPVSGEMFGRFTSLEIATMNMMDEDEQQANARLIAAAPDLLEALQEAVKSGMVPKSSAKEGGANKYSNQVRVADMIRSAIAKATGKQ